MRLARIAHPTDGFAFAEFRKESGFFAEISEHPFGEPVFTGREWPETDVRLLAPILPSKIVCVGKNYAEHAAEMGSEAPETPLIFMKPNTAVIGPGVPISYPPSSNRVDYEGELAVVIGQPCRNVSAVRAPDVVLGYTIGNDVTARDQQATDGQWTRAKGYDTFCPLGPWIDTAFDPDGIDVTTRLSDADGRETTRQTGNTSQFIHTIGDIIAYISAVMTLMPGDVILTGTPAGVGPMVPGESVTVEIEGLGRLTNPVVAPS